MLQTNLIKEKKEEKKDRKNKKRKEKKSTAEKVAVMTRQKSVKISNLLTFSFFQFEHRHRCIPLYKLGLQLF